MGEDEPVSDVLLSFRNVSFAYSREILHRLNLDITRSSFNCLLGSSGCGKSTLLRLAAGFLSPREGEVLFHGRRIAAPSRSSMLIYQEQDQLFPWKRLLGNIALPLAVGPGRLPLKEAEERSFEALVKVGLGERTEAFPHQLSGGMKQRAVLARTLAAGAEMVFFDEPFASLDAFSRETLQELLVETWKENGLTVLFVTHDIREAVRIGETLLFMDPCEEVQGLREQIVPLTPSGGTPRDLESAGSALLVREAKERLRPGRG
jgi:ABC-type nitrate/sulfonate/bicarbonate transport system ATPase subunit